MNENSEKTVLISVNPKAGRTSPTLRAEELQRRLRDKGFQVVLGTDLDEITSRAKELQHSGQLQTLVGVGGDGTAAELVNRTEPGTPIILLAAGTANLLSKHYRWGSSPKRLADIIETGDRLTLDAGLANGRLFLVMVSCGFDARTVELVHAHREENYRKGAKKGAHISYFSYVKPVFKAISDYSYPKIQIEVPGEGEENLEDNLTVEDARWAFVFNLNRYGWGLPLAPGAVGNDGLLDLCAMKGGSLLHGIKYVSFAQFGGLHRFLGDVLLKKAKRFRITSEQPVPYQLDGDPGGQLPLDIEIVENRLTLLVPKKK